MGDEGGDDKMVIWHVQNEARNSMELNYLDGANTMNFTVDSKDKQGDAHQNVRFTSNFRQPDVGGRVMVTMENEGCMEAQVRSSTSKYTV